MNHKLWCRNLMKYLSTFSRSHKHKRLSMLCMRNETKIVFKKYQAENFNFFSPFSLNIHAYIRFEVKWWISFNKGKELCIKILNGICHKHYHWYHYALYLIKFKLVSIMKISRNLYLGWIIELNIGFFFVFVLLCINIQSVHNVVP